MGAMGAMGRDGRDDGGRGYGRDGRGWRDGRGQWALGAAALAQVSRETLAALFHVKPSARLNGA